MFEEPVKAEGRYRLGCDIGGTFTDLILYDEDSRTTTLHKVLTTPRDPSDGLMQGIADLAERNPGMLARIRHVIHGTTLVINAVIERKGAKTALITTEGFRDILEMRRHRRNDVYDIRGAPPRPLVSRDLRLEVAERTYSDGRVLKPLDEASLRALAADLRRMKVESVAVSFLHSFVNPTNEGRAIEILQEELPGVTLSASHKVLPEIKEFERTSTTVVNAYAQPLVETYLERIATRLKGSGSDAPLLLMHSGGGLIPRAAAAQFPVRLIESGPVAGVLAAARVGKQVGHASVLAYDMGGTTAKACLVKGGQLPITTEFEVDRVLRFRKGSGTPVGVPAIDLVEIGTGGGSIAKMNDRGLLSVGPQSAGADPGPICYGRGGLNPTVTDADLLLGYLNPTYFLGGKMKLHHEAAEVAINKFVAEPLGLSIERCAWGIHDLANETMAAAARMHLAERGCDPRSIAMVAFGGAGPLHAQGVARKLGIPRIIIPFAAGVVSALGMLIAPMSYNVARSYSKRLVDTDPLVLDNLWAALEADATEVMRQADAAALISFEYALDVRYAGQGASLTLQLPAPMGRPRLDIDAVTKDFLLSYKNRYGHAYADTPLAIARLRVTASIGLDLIQVASAQSASSGKSEAAHKGVRRAYSQASGQFEDHAIYDRYALATGATIVGPAIIEEAECTTLVGAGVKASVHSEGHLILDLPEAAV